MMYMYRVSVTVKVFGKKISVDKDIIRGRVTKMGRDYINLNSFPESYGDLSSVRVPKDECYTELEDAKKAAETKANDLITQLMLAIDELKQDAKVLDKLA